MVNLNNLAKEITLSEGKKKQISIGQVKEVMKLVFTYLASIEQDEVFKILKRYK